MKTITLKYQQLPELGCPLALAVGYFDGLHLGHQALIKQALSLAQEHGYASAVLSFHPNPLVTLGKMKEERYLSSLEDRQNILEKMGVDYFLILDFTWEVAQMLPEDFIEHFLIDLHVQEVVCGFDFYFGRQGKGNGALLQQYQQAFHVTIIDEIDMDEQKIGSTRIIHLLEEGQISKANQLLTRPYHIRGQVIKGKQRGRLLGFPTANIAYGAYYLPKFGVYGVKIDVAGKSCIGMCNIGYNPTFKDITHPSMEVHIFDFNEDIYGEIADVYFYVFTRPERSFASQLDLINQLNSDQQEIRTFFQTAE